MNVKIKIHNQKCKPLQIDVGDWIDLRSAETVELKLGEFKLISLGISIELPSGYEAHIAPRSSTYKNFGILLANSFGIIDNSYCGNNDIWRFPALALRDTTINEGDRICQFRIMEIQPKINFIEVDDLGNSDRGGLGSTGVK